MDMIRGGWGMGLLGNGMGVATGGGSSYAAETEAIAAAFTTPPTTARKNLIDAAVVSLKSAGVWTKLDALYMFAAADSQAAKINWKNPGTYNATEVNSPTFTADSGFTGASTKYLSTGFTPSTAPTPQYALNSASAFGWSLTAAPAGGNGIIGTQTSNFMRLYPLAAGNFYARLNIASDSLDANADGRGLYAAARSASGTFSKYKNGALVSSPAAVSTNVPASPILFLDGNYVGDVAGGGFGSSLNSTEQTALYNALRTYMTGVGVP